MDMRNPTAPLMFIRCMHTERLEPPRRRRGEPGRPRRPHGGQRGDADPRGGAQAGALRCSQHDAGQIHGSISGCSERSQSASLALSRAHLNPDSGGRPCRGSRRVRLTVALLLTAPCGFPACHGSASSNVQQSCTLARATSTRRSSQYYVRECSQALPTCICKMACVGMASACDPEQPRCMLCVDI